MNRFQYYTGKKVLGPDLNELQGWIEDAVRRNLGYRGIFGIVSGAGYTVTPGTGFSLMIDSQGPTNLRGYSRGGHYISLDANPYDTGDLSAQFSLPSAGNENWLTIYLKHLVVESQLEREKVTFLPKSFRQTESFEIIVDEGVEAPLGTAVKPSIVGSDDTLYLCDVLINSTSTDFTVSPPVKDSSRMEVDPVAEVSERVSLAGDRFGSEAKLALVGALSGLRFRDIQGSDVDLEDALLASLAAGASGADRLALLSEVLSASTIFSASNLASVAGSTTGGTSVILSHTWDVGTKFLFVYCSAAETTPYEAQPGLFVIDVVNSRIWGGAYSYRLTLGRPIAAVNHVNAAVGAGVSLAPNGHLGIAVWNTVARNIQIQVVASQNPTLFQAIIIGSK